MSDMPEYGLIADIGGTNARFALAPLRHFRESSALKLSEQDILHTSKLDGSAYATISDAIESYLAGLPDHIQRPRHGVMAIACPTDTDHIRMTNHTWQFSVSELRQQLGFDSLRFINDYNAQAHSVPHLGHTGALQVGDGKPVAGDPVVITGPGTGLGLGILIFDSAGVPHAIETEGGHANFAPATDIEMEILRFLWQRHARVSAERLLSGMGLENIYEALHSIRRGEASRIPAPEVTRLALDEQDELAREALNVMCEILGNFAGNAALTCGARGGVYLAGGILPRFVEFFRNSRFRECFENKGRLSSFVKSIPTYMILSEQPGLLGAAAVLNHDVNGH